MYLVINYQELKLVCEESLSSNKSTWDFLNLLYCYNISTPDIHGREEYPAGNNLNLLDIKKFHFQNN